MSRFRIALPVSDEKGLDDVVFEHFGHAPYFLLVDVEDGRIVHWEVKENPYVSEHRPGQVPSWLKELGVEVLICLGLGGRARMLFEELGVEVITGASGKAGDVLEAYLKGELTSKDYTPRSKWHKS